MTMIHPVGMAYLLSYWATDRLAITVAGLWEDHQLISSMFDISLPTDCPATAVAQQSVIQEESSLVGMALNLQTLLKLEYRVTCCNVHRK